MNSLWPLSLPRRESITTSIYHFRINKTNTIKSSNRYRAAKLRLALLVVVITGSQISKFLPLKMGQVQTLFLELWIAINKSKRGPSNHKAFLTREGTKLIQDRGKYFKFMFHFKDENSYIFTI